MRKNRRLLRREPLMEVFLGGIIALAWFAVVIWGAVSLVIQAKRKNDWETVGVATVSATTVAGPLLVLSPEHVFFGVHTIGLGFVLAAISGLVIWAYASTRST
jgi:uncharacterized membrane protein YcjF (UPF0283 family)